MSQTESKWQTRELTNAFLDGVRGAIPGAEMQLAVMGKIIQQWCGKPGYVLDLGCGNGILGQYILKMHPSAHITFADFSEPMLEAVREGLDGKTGMSIVKADFTTPGWLETVEARKPFDLVVSGFAIHHQRNERKKELYAEIFELLAPGGVFLNLEHVSSATPPVGRLFDDFFVDHLYQYHAAKDPEATRESIADTYYHRPDKAENILAPVQEQCKWLRDMRFEDVDCFFKVFELSIFGGRKPSGS